MERRRRKTGWGCSTGGESVCKQGFGVGKIKDFVSFFYPFAPHFLHFFFFSFYPYLTLTQVKTTDNSQLQENAPKAAPFSCKIAAPRTRSCPLRSPLRRTGLRAAPRRT